jgi:transposase
MAYSEDLRKKAMEYYHEGHSLRGTAQVFHVSYVAVRGWKQLEETTGSLKKRELHRSFKKIDPVKLQEYMNEHPDAYLKEIAAFFHCGNTSVDKALKKCGITRKKRLQSTAKGTKKNGSTLS